MDGRYVEGNLSHPRTAVGRLGTDALNGYYDASVLNEEMTRTGAHGRGA